MDATQASVTATAVTSRTFPAELVLPMIFDCPLWPSAELDPLRLMSFLTGIKRMGYPPGAHQVCQEWLIEQFPSTQEPVPPHSEVSTLFRQLRAEAEVRSGELAQWLEDVAKAASTRLELGPDRSEQLFELADDLDFFLLAQPNRSKAAQVWFARASRMLFGDALAVPSRVGQPLLEQLLQLWRRREDEALHMHGLWLETRRCAASMPSIVNVKPLPADIYTEEHLRNEVDATTRAVATPRGVSSVRWTWGRLDYFRTVRVSRSNTH